MLRIELGDWEAMRKWAEPIRFAVFVNEQKVPPEMELDAWDPGSVHAVAFDSTAAVGESSCSIQSKRSTGRPRTHC